MRLVALVAATAGLLQSDSRCLPCHAELVKSYSATGMGRSITEAAFESDVTSVFRHERSGTTFRVLTSSNKVVHEAVRDGRRAAYRPAWAIGSGNHGKSFLHMIGDSLFQSPISWYARRAAFDVSPGFEQETNPDFFRPVTSECLFCHAGAARPRRGTQNRYLKPPFQPASIGCDRCHGDVSAHLTHPERSTIINPARLESQRRDAVCEQCHLSGEARIPNPGNQFSDFRPGMRMEDVFVVYVRDSVGDERGLKVVSHSEQMALSRCFTESRSKLWCATCHDPHSKPADKVAWFRGKCLACHSGQKITAHRAKAGDDCAGCHMPEVSVYDGGHTAFHDHWIRVRRETPSLEQSQRLRAWREVSGNLRNRNLGLAYISFGSKSGDRNLMTTGFKLLGSQPADVAVETARGLILLRMNKAVEAVHSLRRAVNENPRDSTARYNLAVALLAAGDRSAAMRNVEEAIALEPLLEEAYVLAAEIEPHRSGEWKQRYRMLAPQRFLR